MNSFLFHLAVLLDITSFALITPFLLNFITAVGYTESDVGWIQSIYGIMQIISLPLSGYLTTKYGNRKILLLAIFATTISLFFNSVSIFQASQFLHLVFRVSSGLCRQTHSIGNAIVLDLAGHDGGNRAKAISALQAVISGGFIVGPALGGWVMDSFGLQIHSLVAAVMSASSSLLFFYVTRKKIYNYENYEKDQMMQLKDGEGKQATAQHKTTPSTISKIVVALRKVFFEGGWQLRLLALAMFANSVTYTGLHFTNLIYLKHRFDLSGMQVGLTLSSMSALSAGSQFLGVRSILKFTSALSSSKNGRMNLFLLLDTPRKCILLATWLGTVFGVFLLAFSDQFIFYFIGLMVFSIAAAVVDSFAKATLTLHFGNENALAMTLLGCMDGTNRMLLPLFNMWLVRQFDGEVSAPLYFAAIASVSCSLAHSFGTTGAKISVE